MNKENNSNAARITGIFVIVAALISGSFLILNTLVQQGKINFGLSPNQVGVTPIGTPIFIKQIKIDSARSAGWVYQVPQPGTYVFEYANSAAAAWQVTGTADEPRRWSTMVVAFSGSVPQMTRAGLDTDAALFVLGNIYDTEQEAIQKTQGEKIALKLKRGEELTLVFFDCPSCYFDNVGSILINVYYYP